MRLAAERPANLRAAVLASCSLPTRTRPRNPASPSCRRVVDPADVSSCSARVRHRPQPGGGLVAALPDPAAAARRRRRAQGPRHVAAHDQGLLPSRARLARRPGHRRARTGQAVSPAGRGGRSRPRPRAGEPLAVRVRQGPRARRHLLAVGTHRPPGAPERQPPDRSRRGRTAGDRRRQPRAVPVDVQPPAGDDASAGARRRRLRSRARRAGRRRRRTQVAPRPGLDVDQRQAAVRAGRPRRRCPPPPSSSRTATRPCSSSSTSDPRWSPAGSARPPHGSRPYRSCSPRPGRSPRSGPTASSARRSPTTTTTWARSIWPPTCPVPVPSRDLRRRARRSGRGPAPRAFPCPTGVVSIPTCGGPTTPAHST